MALEDVKRYYAAFDEWARLERPMGRLEFDRALGYLHKYLPNPCRILDLGCGPGRYAIALAQSGRTVTLADLSSTQLEIAREKIAAARLMDSVEGFHELNATSMGIFKDNSFDAVVAFGPFYHLTAQEDRQKVAGEIARVLRPGGHVFVAFIPKYFHLTHLILRALASPEQVCPENFVEAYEIGKFINRNPNGFQEAYFAGPAEIRETLAREGLECTLTASLRGFANGYEEQLFTIAETNPELFKVIMDVLDRSSSDPSVIEMSGHAIAIAQKTR